MYVAMNRFRINVEREAEWEQIWRERKTFLPDAEGFLQFMMMRGAEPGDYVSYSAWESADAFCDWVKSDAFHQAHAQRIPDGIIVSGSPILGLYEPVITETPTSRESSPTVPDPNRHSPLD